MSASVLIARGSKITLPITYTADNFQDNFQDSSVQPVKKGSLREASGCIKVSRTFHP
jgi:hypothetical protein